MSGNIPVLNGGIQRSRVQDNVKVAGRYADAANMTVLNSAMVSVH
jgi:hypothetical protein